MRPQRKHVRGNHALRTKSQPKRCHSQPSAASVRRIEQRHCRMSESGVGTGHNAVERRHGDSGGQPTGAYRVSGVDLCVSLYPYGAAFCLILLVLYEIIALSLPSQMIS